MQPQFSSMLATLLVVIAGVTVLIMLEMNGKMKGTQRKKSIWVVLHRFLGYLFLVLFASMLVYMVVRAGSFQEDLPAKAMLHIVFALLLIPLIMVKVVIARRHAQLSTKLILLGMAIFGLSFGLTGITAGYYALHGGDFRYSALSDGANEDILSVELGQKIMSRKCRKCHSLERVYRTYKSDMAWTETINKMATLDYPNITNSDVKQIVDYLSKQQEKRQVDADTEIGRNLVSQKCSICHGLDKVFGADMDRQKWKETVENMGEMMGDPDFLSVQEKKSITHFLATRKQRIGETGKKKQDDSQLEAVRLLVARKCSNGCHALDRVLRGDKTEEEWRATVESMIEISGNPEYLTDQEQEDIIHFLRTIKERGIERNGVRPRASGEDHPLISRKCSVCHDLERVHKAGKSKEEWTETVNDMAEKKGDPQYLSEQEKEEIITIMSSWEVLEK